MNLEFDVSYEGLEGAISLTSRPYIYQSFNFMNYKWDPLSTRLSNDRGSRIEGFEKNMREYELVVQVYGRHEQNAAEIRNRLTRIFEKDIVNQSPGKLVVNGSYLRCYIVAQGKGRWIRDVNHLEVKLTVLAPYPAWITERKVQIIQTGDFEATGGKVYEFTYPYSYVFDGKSTTYNNSFITDVHAKIAFYGHARNPSITIGDKQWIVYETIEAGERIEIDPFERTVIKIYSDGFKENVFHARGKSHSVFSPFPEGSFTISTANDVELTFYEESSEPPWN